MTEDMQKNGKTGRKKFHFEWLLPLFLHPKRTIQTIVEQDKPVWLTPLTALSAFILVYELVALPIRRMQVINGANLPVDFQYYSAEQQAQFINAQATQSSFLFTFIFPFLGALIGIWLSWFLLSSILHLSLTLAGSRTSSLHSKNLVGWSMMPLAVRFIIQIFAMLFTKSLIVSSGLSGFIPADASGGAALWAGILGQIDIYFAWQVILLLLGVLPLSRLTKVKSWTATAVSLLILVLLFALPRFISGALSGVSLSGFYF